MHGATELVYVVDGFTKQPGDTQFYNFMYASQYGSPDKHWILYLLGDGLGRS